MLRPVRARCRQGTALRPGVLPLALCSVLVACSGSKRRASSHEELPGLPTAISPRARLSVGVMSGDTTQMFGRVVTPFLLPDGRLVVPDAGGHTIRVFGRGGEFQQELGRQGKGPGEFSSLTDAWARGDTIEALDFDLARITRFPPAGQPEVVPLKGGPQPQLVPGPFGSGWVTGAIVGVGVGGRDDWALEQYGPDGALIRTITHVPGMLRIQVPGLQGPGPLSPRQAFAIGGTRLYTGETLTPRLEVWKPDGTLVDTITWQAAPSPNPKETQAEVLDSVEARWRRRQRGFPPKIWREFPVSDRLSAFWDVLVDPEGFVWIRPYRPLVDAAALSSLAGTSPGGTWLIAAPRGGVVDSVTVPADLQPTQVTDSAVVGIARDSLGVESVKVYPLARQPG